MKKLYSIFSITLVSMFLITSCQEDDHELGSMLAPSEISFEVVQDFSVDKGGNTVILRNMTPGTVSMWDYGTGRSTRMTDTVRFAFEGEYTITFSALTAGGIVGMDPVTIEVTEDNVSYVNDPLWTALSGGPGNKKEWVLDTESKYFTGPLSFYGTSNGWLLEGGPWLEGAEKTGCYGGDCWTWSPDAAWIYDNAMANGDYGVMSFSLQGGPYFSATKPMEDDVEQNGTFFLNVNDKILTINDASILRGYKPEKNGLTGISDWSNYAIFALDENILRLGVIRDKDVDGEGAAMLVYNFISKEYSDNWVPEEQEPAGPDEGFNPEFASGELLDMLTGGTSAGRLWKLDAAGNPVDWLASGTGWTVSSDDSRDWGWNDSWDAVAESSWILFDNLGGQNYTRNQNGVFTTGTFSINEETSEITLESNTLIQNQSSWMSPVANTITVVKAFPGEAVSKGIWFGTNYDAAKDEWLVFHYVVSSD